MPLTAGQMLITILAIALGVQISRWLPFLAFREDRNIPSFILYLGKALPPALMGFLVVYCLKDITVISFPFGLPELIAVLAVIGLYLWKKSTLMSVAGGTAIYMVLVQLVF